MGFNQLILNDKLLIASHSVALLLCFCLLACGGGSKKEPTVIPDDPTPSITKIIVSQVASHSATLEFTTIPAMQANIQIKLLTDLDTLAPVISLTSTAKQNHQIAIPNLWSSADWKIIIQADDLVANTNFSTLSPDWAASQCRKGSLSLPLAGANQWNTFTDQNGTVVVSSTDGCDTNTQAVEFDYDLGDGEWVVAQAVNFSAPIDLSTSTHLWVPIKGQANSKIALEVKLRDQQGNLSFVRLDGGTGIPVWRSWAVDLAEFSAQIGSLDLSAISGIEVAFSLPLAAGSDRQGKLSIAELQAWDLFTQRPTINQFERVIHDTQAMSEIANDLLSRQQSHGLITAWFELDENLHLYANAMALIVFSLEYQRLNELADPLASGFQNAAKKIADALVELQNLSDRNGAWDDSFIQQNGVLALRSSESRILWVGSTAWAGISLIFARDLLAQGDLYDSAIANAAAFYDTRQQCRNLAELPQGSITEGTEGNISSQLFLAAAASRGLGEQRVADELSGFIGDYLFDTTQQRFYCGLKLNFASGYNESTCSANGVHQIIGGDARSCIDVIANWGVEWLRQQGRDNDALQGLAYSRYVFPTQSFSQPVINGLGDIAGPWTPTVEHGAGQWAVAGGADASYVLKQAQDQLCFDGACQGSADDLLVGISWNSISTGVSPAAWMYLAYHGQFWNTLSGQTQQ